MFSLIFLIIFIVLLFWFVNNKVRIKFKTFFRKGFKARRGKFGVYCYCGKQGTGKTYSVVEFLHNNCDMRIYANLQSLDLKDENGIQIDVNYIKNFSELLELRNEHDCIIFYDEIFSALLKNTRLSKEVINFLSQMRKRKIIFLTTAQEWTEVPLSFRRFCRYQIDCSIFNLFPFSILIKVFKDAENMKWSNDDQEHIAPILETSISKMNLYVANSYDTFEEINDLS